MLYKATPRHWGMNTSRVYRREAYIVPDFFNLGSSTVCGTNSNLGEIPNCWERGIQEGKETGEEIPKFLLTPESHTYRTGFKDLS